MFGKNKLAIEKLTRRIETLVERIGYLQDRLEKLEKENFDTALKKIGKLDIETKFSILEQRVAELRQPQKYSGFVKYQGGKYEVLHSDLRIKTDSLSEYFTRHERFYTLVFHEGKELKQITHVPESEITPFKK